MSTNTTIASTKSTVTTTASYNYSGSNTPQKVESYKGKLESAGLVQKSTNSSAAGAFKWAERIVTPSMFATPDSCLIALAPPVASLAKGTGDYSLVGLCSNFNFSLQNNIYSFKEFRSERNIIVPMKSQPGQLSLSRFMGAYPNFSAMVAGTQQWMFNNQARVSKKLFGMMLIFMNSARTDTMGILYFERCGIMNQSVAGQAGQFSITESVNIIFDRVVDNVAIAGTGTSYNVQTSSTSTTDNTSQSSLPDYTEEETGGRVDPLLNDTTQILSNQIREFPFDQYSKLQTIANYCSKRVSELQVTDSNYKTNSEYKACLDLYSYYNSQIIPYYHRIYNAAGNPSPLNETELDSFKKKLSSYSNSVSTYRNQGIHLPSV